MKNLRQGIVATNTTWLGAEHFTSDQFTIHQSVTKFWKQKIDLKQEAMPTIFVFPIKTKAKTWKTFTAFLNPQAKFH